jgi:hypothetical protein
MGVVASSEAETEDQRSQQSKSPTMSNQEPEEGEYGSGLVAGYGDFTWTVVRGGAA